MILKEKNSQKGMTIIELLIVVAIIAILLGISFWGYHKRGEELSLRRVAYQMMSDIEKTREMAMSARKLSSGDRPEGGYGLNLDTASPGQYVIFADLGTSPDKTYNGSSEAVETISLGTKIVIQGIKIGSSPKNVVNIVFIPPSPDVYINTLSPSAPVEITLALKSDSSKIKKIFINSTGLVWISN